MKKTFYISCCFIFLLLSSCRKDQVIYMSEQKIVAPPSIKNDQKPDNQKQHVDTQHNKNSKIKGFYLLNEGNMGMNRATIDYMDYQTGIYNIDIYSERNPDIVKELGDVGNDIKRYGSKVYAVINCSNYIEVINANTAKHVGSINVPNCRYMAFNNGKAYISSYSGPVQVSPNAEKGFVAEIDTTTLKLTGRKVTVGYQPEEMVIKDNKLYVANSGGYRVPNYDRTVSVIDLNSFKVIKTIDVAINLHRMAIDKRGYIYVSSRGDYYTKHSNLSIIDSKTDKVVKKLDIPISEMTMSGDSLYYYSVEFSYITGKNEVSYGILNTKNWKIITHNFITDGTDKDIMIPYGLAINPDTKEILVTDAQNYVVTGYVYCFSPDGKLEWKTKAGDIPAHFVFIR